MQMTAESHLIVWFNAIILVDFSYPSGKLFLIVFSWRSFPTTLVRALMHFKHFYLHDSHITVVENDRHEIISVQIKAVLALDWCTNITLSVSLEYFVKSITSNILMTRNQGIVSCFLSGISSSKKNLHASNLVMQIFISQFSFANDVTLLITAGWR